MEVAIKTDRQKTRESLVLREKNAGWSECSLCSLGQHASETERMYNFERGGVPVLEIFARLCKANYQSIHLHYQSVHLHYQSVHLQLVVQVAVPVT